LEHLLLRLEEGFVRRAEEARSLRDNEDAFRANVREDTLSNGVSTVIIVLDCVDNIVFLVAHPNLTTVGPEAYRHYSWSFNLTVIKNTGRSKYVRDLRGISKPVNPKDGALLARYDHVKAKCAKMVERNPVVVH